MNSQLQGPGIPMDQLMNTNTLVQRQQREIAALSARCAKLERDAARYRWLRDECKDPDVLAGLGWISQEHPSLDAAIDSALTTDGKP